MLKPNTFAEDFQTIYSYIITSLSKANEQLSSIIKERPFIVNNKTPKMIKVTKLENCNLRILFDNNEIREQNIRKFIENILNDENENEILNSIIISEDGYFLLNHKGDKILNAYSVWNFRNDIVSVNKTNNTKDDIVNMVNKLLRIVNHIDEVLEVNNDGKHT